MFASKSPWRPAIRREHALALQAVQNGHEAWFVERQADIRAAARPKERTAWIRGLAGSAQSTEPEPGLMVTPTATVLPGHRSGLAERTSTYLLHRDLQRIVTRVRPTAVVAATPWQWPAVSALRGVRRVFEADDDWRELIPQRATRIGELYERAAREADAVVLVSEDMRQVFAPRPVIVVPNGVSQELLDPPATPAPGNRTLVYVGTLSPRFDAPLVRSVLEHLPGWRLNLYGQCQYPGRGDVPDDELSGLLRDFPDRLSWHGVMDRRGLAAVIDAADVTLIPNRVALMHGQDSMKLYDYAARGRPIVATGQASQSDARAGVRRANDPGGLADAIRAADDESIAHRAARRAWALEQSWSARWPEWWAAVAGRPAAPRRTAD